MRMIDADARVTVQSFDVEHEEYDHTEMSVEEALDFATDEGCPPVIDAEPVRHGRWVKEPSRKCHCQWHCSECGFVEMIVLRFHYCPGCGAKMGSVIDEYKAAIDNLTHDMRYEPTFSVEDGSM